MLLRDLKLAPREGDSVHYWDCILIGLRHPYSLYIERMVDPDEARSGGPWCIVFNSAPVSVGHNICESKARRHHSWLEELEAQAVLDHYVSVYGLPEQVTS